MIISCTEISLKHHSDKKYFDALKQALISPWKLINPKIKHFC